jgi:hypothetical protein
VPVASLPYWTSSVGIYLWTPTPNIRLLKGFQLPARGQWAELNQRSIGLLWRRGRLFDSGSNMSTTICKFEDIFSRDLTWVNHAPGGFDGKHGLREKWALRLVSTRLGALDKNTADIFLITVRLPGSKIILPTLRLSSYFTSLIVLFPVFLHVWPCLTICVLSYYCSAFFLHFPLTILYYYYSFQIGRCLLYPPLRRVRTVFSTSNSSIKCYLIYSSNVVFLELLVKQAPGIGNLVTFSQEFIT